jgi:hypothetical protein
MSNSVPKKGLSPLAWIAIGCGALVLVGGVVLVGLLGFGLFKAKEMVADFEGNPAKAAAEMMVKLNPELELVESDDEAGTITIKNTETGEAMTVDFEDITEGRLSFTTEDGEVRIDASEGGEGTMTFSGDEGEVRIGASLENVPDWVPLYPGASDTGGSYTSKTQEGVTGLVAMTTADDAATVLAFYEEWLSDQGYELTGRSTTSSGEGTFATLRGEVKEPARNLVIVVVRQGDETQVNVSFTES